MLAGELLKASLQSGSPIASKDAEKLSAPNFGCAVHRLLLAWRQSGGFGPDEAVLLRQAVRRHPGSRIFIGRLHEAVNTHLEKVGLTMQYDGYLEAEAYSREPLRGCDNAPTLRELDEHILGEAYLGSVGYSHWKSAAQKEAAWATLNTAPGKTRLVVLPTGSGKSLCFQILPRFSSGLTVVIVPTIALAMDQQSIAAKLLRDLPGVDPLFFAADDSPESTFAKTKNRQTRLLFASPEACVSGRLRPVLDRFAEEGWLEHLVIDEAHLVETWGANFRVEFQILASARRRWLSASGGKLRTYLFSATMTPQCRSLLGELFSDGMPAEEFVCQRLRPEIRYYIEQFGDDDQGRDTAVTESLWHLPRPAILYTTERDEAERFLEIMRGEGFRRLGCFHGDTPSSERRDLLHRWKCGDIDLMIATTAFGVGVDKPDVRAVVHACFPENLDRYYQEVGRGGRDGWSSVSILLPTCKDRRVAEGITVRLMRTEMIQERWRAMFRNAEGLDNHVWALPMSSKRTELVGLRTYDENIRWNKRLVIQLHRAKKLELLDISLRPSPAAGGEAEEWAVVKVKFPPTTLSLDKLMEEQRCNEVAYFQRGLQHIDAFVKAERCAARQFAELYGIDDRQRVCPGCPWCRASEREPLECPILLYPQAKRPTSNASSHIIERFPSPAKADERGDFIHCIHRAVTEKLLRHFVCSSNRFRESSACFQEAFPQSSPQLYRLDLLDDRWAVGAGATLPLVFLHVGKFSARALDAGRGFRSVHLFCGVDHPYDSNGRHVAVNECARRWPDAGAWLGEWQND